MIYFLIIISLIVFSIRYDVCGRTKYKNECYYFLLLVFILVAGLRWRIAIDTPNYIDKFYHLYPDLSHFSFKEYPIGKDPFFVLLCSIVKSAGGRFYVVQLIQASFVNILLFKYIKKHSEYIFTCLLFYFFFAYYNYSMEIMRGSMSIVLSLYANDYILERKWIKGYLLLMFGCMFHAQTFLLFVLPLLFFIKFDKIGLVVVIMAFILGVFAQALLNDYLFLLEDSPDLEDKVYYYASSENYSEQTGNVNYYIVKIFPIIFYSVFSFYYVKKKCPRNGILKLEPFLMLLILFTTMQMSMQIAYRYVDYYKIYGILFFSESYVELIKRSKRLDVFLAYSRSLVLFFPLFFLTYYREHIEWFYPYSSVIDRQTDVKRESIYLKWNRPRAKDYEY